MWPAADEFNCRCSRVLFLINMQTAYVSPPFGYNIFYMRTVAPPEVKVIDIYMSVWPYVILMGIGLVLCMIFPELITWLPSKLMSN
jgi:TRAP-type mannitol/chloroaromatic compound transport system permease large subunit